MKKSTLLLTSILVLTVPSLLSADVTFYDSRSDFEAAAQNLVTEGFETANLAPGGVATMRGPLNTFTDNGIFSPGDIDPNISVNTTPNSTSEIMPVIGDGVLTGQSKMIGSQVIGQMTDFALRVLFDLDVQAVGADLFAANEPGDSVAGLARVSVFDSGGSVMASIDVDLETVSGGFFGVTSDEAISGFTFRNIQQSGQSRYTEFIDNISFSNTAIPEPTVVPLIILGGVIASLRRTKA